MQEQGPHILKSMFGAIEAGGTKFVCGIGTGPDDLQTAQFPTSTPEITVASVIEFFQKSKVDLAAIGIGSFGPVDINRNSSTYGHITSTPKVGWQNFDLRGTIERALRVPVAFDTDVNGAILAEARWGAAKGLDNAIYMTIGTGIGGGALVHGRVLHGLVHPEMGHLHIPHDRARDPFPGICPYHGDCLEGLASGPAMQARWNQPGSTLRPEHPGWDLEAHYLALGLMNLAVAFSPQRIIMGGGVMGQQHMLEKLRAEFKKIMNGYIRHPDVNDHVDLFIQAPALGSLSGILGALVLAEQIDSEIVMEQTMKRPEKQA